MRLLALSRPAQLAGSLALFASVGLVGCSLLQQVGGTQCTETSDCEALGGDFVGTVCQASFCVTPDTGTGGMGGGGSGECTTNSACIDAPENFGEPAACIEGTCVPLKTDECPWVLGLGEDFANLRKPEPIIIGAYAPIDPVAPTTSAYMLNYEFAIDEVNGVTGGGIPGGPGGSSRPFVAVVCDSVDNPDLPASMDHLIEDLQVPAILSALYAPELKEMFNTKGLPNDVFFMSPIDADTTLTGILDNGLLWHMLPEGRDLAPGYVALVAEAEEYVRVQRGLSPTDPVKVALVDAKCQFLLDISTRVLMEMTFNGGLSVVANQNNGHFRRLQTECAAEFDQPDVSGTVEQLLDFVPDILVSIGADESLDLVGGLEAGWMPALGPKPFYLASPWVFGLPALTSSTLANAHQRLIGVNFAGAENPMLYEQFLINIQAAYEGVEGLDGKENFYDAAFYLMYAIAAAGDPSRLTGRHIAQGLERVIDTFASESFPVGRDSFNSALAYLNIPDSTIELIGTLGPPEFSTTGARKGLPSYFCVDNGVRIQNALLYDKDTGTISGSQPCVPYFPP